MAVNFPDTPSEGQAIQVGMSIYTYTSGRWLQRPYPRARPFNYLINPAFQISQEQGSNFGNTNVFYPADQWTIRFVGTQGGAIQRFVTTDPTLSPYYLQFYAPTAKPSLAAGDYIFLHQFIEGQRMAGLLFGTTSAKRVVARFTAWAAAPGTYAFNLRNGLGDRSYVVPIALTASPKVFELSIPGDTTGTWPVDNSPAMQWAITGASGATFLTASPNSWQAGNFLGHTGMANIAASAVQVIVVARCGLYGDPDGNLLAPIWECPTDREVVYECGRYWRKTTHLQGLAVSQTTSSPQRTSAIAMVPSRIVPAVSLVGANLVSNDAASEQKITSIAASAFGQNSDEMNFNIAAAQNTGRGAVVYYTAAGSYLAVNSRM
jgi:hypothetical protein